MEAFSTGFGLVVVAFWIGFSLSAVISLFRTDVAGD